MSLTTPASSQPRAPDREQRALDVVHDLRRRRVGQPGGQRLLVGGVEVRAEVDEGGWSSAAASAMPVSSPVPRPQVPRKISAGAAGAGVRLQPVAPARPAEHVVLGDVEAALGLRLGAGQRGEQPVAQHPELQVVEELCAPRRGPTAGRRGRPGPSSSGTSRTSSVSRRFCSTERQVLAQRLADLALDLVDPVDQRVERAELADPLGRGLLPHARDARQVVARVAAQRREVGVLRRGQAVLGLDLLRGEPGQVGDALARVEHGDVVVDQLERVAVAGADQHVHALLDRLRR